MLGPIRKSMFPSTSLFTILKSSTVLFERPRVQATSPSESNARISALKPATSKSDESVSSKTNRGELPEFLIDHPSTWRVSSGLEVPIPTFPHREALIPK